MSAIPSFIIFLLMKQINGATFGYKRPDEWSIDYPTCGGLKQSPIDLKPEEMARLDSLPELEWVGYDSPPISMSIESNGHSVQLAGTWGDNKIPYIYGGVLGGKYAFEQLHFHWGPRNAVGSEHTVNNYTLPLEMHIVHYKMDYGSMSEALKHEDGLAVVGILFTLGDRRNKGIMQLENHKNCLELPGSKVEIVPFPLDEFRFYFHKDYVAYLGSLTTPPCSEIVTWILPASPRLVTRRQMNFFRSIELAHGDDHNYRPTQPVNGRMVYYV